MGYLKPGRRKMGIFVLPFASLFTMMWVGELTVPDSFSEMRAQSQKIWGRSQISGPIDITQHINNVLTDAEIETLPLLDYRVFGNGLVIVQETEKNLYIWVVPSSSIAMLLTLLSAWLLLSKIRNPKPQPEPAPSRA